jgi:hypothetical protein
MKLERVMLAWRPGFEHLRRAGDIETLCGRSVFDREITVLPLELPWGNQAGHCTNCRKASAKLVAGV